MRFISCRVAAGADHALYRTFGDGRILMSSMVAPEDDTAAFCADIGMTTATARVTIRHVAAVLGYRSEALVEWCSADVPGASSDLPLLYYAALLSDDPEADMPLGLGETPAAALTDLLWALGGTALLADLSEPEPTSAADGIVSAAGDALFESR
jgi:hypothetical protein